LYHSTCCALKSQQNNGAHEKRSTLQTIKKLVKCQHCWYE